jgi:hypothetical protein
MIKIWEQNFRSEKEYTEAAYADIGAIKDLKLGVPRPIPLPFPDVALRVTTPNPPADYFRCGPMRVVSEKLMQCLVAKPGLAAQFFPVTMSYLGEPVRTCYYALHVCDVVDCLDLERSDYTLYSDDEDHIKTFKSIVLRPESAEGHPVFILGKTYNVLCVLEEVATEVSAAGCTGTLFLDPSEWPDRHR